MTMTATRSAYPRPVEDLVPEARALADELGALPSRNQLKTRLRIGAPKANTVLDLLGDYIPQAHLTGPVEPNVPPGPAGPASEPAPSAVPVLEPADGSEPEVTVPQVTGLADPAGPATEAAAAETDRAEPAPSKPRRRLATWPVLLLMLPATVAIWSGWVGLGSLAGFGPVHPLPGIADGFVIDTAITLPIGMETYSAYALYVWLSGRASAKAVAFARVSALLALAIGAAGQIAYHLMSAAEVPAAHPLITAAVACIPVAVLGLGAALAHLVKEDR